MHRLEAVIGAATGTTMASERATTTQRQGITVTVTMDLGRTTVATPRTMALEAITGAECISPSDSEDRCFLCLRQGFAQEVSTARRQIKLRSLDHFAASGCHL